MEKVLKLYSYNGDGVENTPFPDVGSQIQIADFTYDAKRMGGAPTITATVMFATCLDDVWTENVYAEFEGEKYFLKQTPTSSYSNEDARYKHEVELISERFILENVYFYDVVASDTTNDKPVSNSSNVTFFGTITEFAKRLNYSLQYAKLQEVDNEGNYASGYRVIVDEGIETEGVLMQFDNQFFANVLQEIYNTYQVPYYFVGKDIHIGFSPHTIETPFEYGQNFSLLSITKTNANYKVVNRATGIGSMDNIPYYYPNQTERGDLSVLLNGEAGKVSIIDKNKLGNFSLNDTLEYLYSEDGYHASFLDGAVLTGDLQSVEFPDRENNVDGFVNGLYVQFKMRLDIPTSVANLESFLKFKNNDPDIYRSNVHFSFYKIEDSDVKILESYSTNEIDYTEELVGGKYMIEYTCETTTTQITDSQSIADYVDKFINLELYQEDLSIKEYWMRNNVQINLAKLGIAINEGVEISSGDKLTLRQDRYIAPQTNLMPSIYRETFGAERFYNALNDTYINPDSENGDYYVFDNPYVDGKPKEQIVSFEEIKPTIVGMKNVDGNLIGMFTEFAYDDDDNDETEEIDGTTYYKHPFFFGKLRKFDGEHGFNLFDHSIDEEEMVVSFTSGSCGACEFTIVVTDDDQKNTVQVDENGNLLRDSKGNVRCGREHYQSAEEPQDRQNDTINNEVWVALRKDDKTFGVIMPNAQHNYKPKASTTNSDGTYNDDGDTFVILHIDLPQAYITSAEEKLKEEIIRYIAENNAEKFNFSITFSRIFLAENPDIYALLNENTYLRISYNDKVYPLYVSSYSYKASSSEALPEITVELNDTLTITQNALQNAISEVRSDIYNVVQDLYYNEDVSSDSSISNKYTDRFLRKDSADTAKYPITFMRGISFGRVYSIDGEGNANLNSITTQKIIADKSSDGVIVSSRNFDGSSALAGTGYGILKEGNSYKMAIDYLTVRKGMSVAELVLQEYKSVGGVLVVSACNGEIEKVHKWSNGVGYDVYIKDFEDNPQFVAGDLVRCAQWDSEANSYVGYWVKVVDVPTDADGYKCLNLMASQFPEGVEPQVGDQLVQFGNTSDTSRQGLILISVENGQPNVTAYDGIDSTSVNMLEKMCARLGDLNGIVIDEEELQGYGLWTNNLYLSSKKVSDTFTEITNSITQAQQDASQALAGVATANQNIVDINKRLDGVVENWFEEGYPDIDSYPVTEWETDNEKLNHIGDTFTNIQEYQNDITTPDAGKSWRWVSATTAPTITEAYVVVNDNGVTKYLYWTPIADSDAVKALLEASKAQYTADGKSRTFVSQPVPPYDEGDLWVQGTNGDILKCITARQEGESFSQSDWAKASKYTDDTETNKLRTEVYSEFENVAGQFTSIQGEITTIKDKQSGMATQISEAKTAIAQNANQINLRATKTELAATETKLQASIDVNANAITSTVESLQSGGRNMLVGTNQGKNGWAIYPSSTSGAGYSVHLDEFVIGQQGDTTDVNKGIYKGVVIVRDDTSTKSVIARFQLRPELFVAGKEYTLSFDVKSVGGTEFKPLFNIMKVNGADALLAGYLSSEFNDTITPNEWTRLYVTFTPTTSGTIDGGQVVYLATGNGIAWSSIYLKNLQIEEGSIASPWSETLADTEKKFSEIRQTADNISFRVVEKGVANINHAIDTEVPYVRNSNFDETNANLTQKMYKVTGFKTGDMITASFDWEWEGLSWANASTSEVSVQFTDVYGYLGLGFRLKSGGANSGHHTATVTLGQKYNTNTDITTSDVAYVYIRFSKIAQSATDGYFRISNLKVESGDTETAWTSRTDDLETAMVETGIDISHRKIVAKADNFEIRNNNGQVTASVNEKGELASNSVFCRNTDETTMAATPYLTTLNRNGNGFLEFFYPLTADNGNDNLAFQIGWDESTESIFRFFNKSGVMTWKAGSEANLIDVTTLGGVVSTTEVALYKCVGTDRISALAEIMTTKSLATTKLYKKTSQTNDLVTTYYYTDSACTIFATGYYADGGVPRYAISTDGSSTKKYSRRVYTMTNGVASVTTYTWTED